jgi:Kef-type K+ transport system membrane component KefB
MEFSQIALVIVVAAVFGIFSRILKQPLILGYLFAGLLLSQFGLMEDATSFHGLGQIGVALLLFLVGLEMDLSDLPSIGRVALFTGIGQIVFTSVIGFGLAALLGFGIVPALYIAVALTFSSTIIIVKLLGEKNDLDTLYGKIAVGFLLVQDLVVVLILMVLGGLGGGDLSALSFLAIGVKALVLIAAVWYLSRRVLPIIFSKIVSDSTELIFIVSIGWALGIAELVGGPLGFSPEIGGFLAGLALSQLPEHLQVASRAKPLRDFFLTIFFMMLGASLVIEGLLGLLVPAILFSLFVLVGNPIIVIFIMSALGYKSRTSFMASVTVAQISEFSLIMMAMGLAAGHVQESHVAMVVLVGVITMTVSTYMIMGADRLYLLFEKMLVKFERKNLQEAALTTKGEFSDHVVLVGADRTGEALITMFTNRKTPFVVVDFNPTVVKRLIDLQVPVIFGDINDQSVRDSANLPGSKMIVVTTSDMHDNLTLLEFMKGHSEEQAIVMKAESSNQAIKLYEAGATYVMIPEVIAGEHVRHLFRTYGLGQSRLHKIGQNHYKRLLKK